MKKKVTTYHKELLTAIYHLIVALALFSLVYVLNNFTLAENGNLTIINQPSTTEIKPITYEDLSTMSYKLVTLHIKIGTSRGNLELLKLNIDNDILESISDAERLVREDIIENLKNTPNKVSAMNTYLQNMDSTLSRGSFFIMILDQDISTRTQQMNLCIQEKQLSDQAYFNSINYYDQQGMVESLKKSTVYNTCIAQARLEINAKTAVASKLKFYYDLLHTKYNFLSQYQEIILKNVNVLDTEILHELDVINSTLNTYNF